ncbi:unnamed protein product [Closterium sp. Naga37s-1]|nr:unnamed protein product [Closterium sp. Naga37s-1]
MGEVVIAVTFPPPYRRFPPPVSPVRRPISRARRPISPSRGPISPSCRPISPSRILSPFRVASSRLSARPPLASPRGLLSSLRAASSRLSARPPLTSPRGLLSPPRAVSSRLPARPPLASPRGLLSPPLATPRGLLSPLRAASSRLSARPPLASPRGLLSPLRAASSPLPLPSLPPPIAIASPSRRPRFPLPSPSLPPPIALASPSHRPRFPLPSPSLPPPVALASPSLCPRFPLPSPSLPPPIALASPSRRPCFPLPSPSLPPPIASPLAPSLLVHLRHLSVWGSSITNASAPLLPFPPLPPSSFHPRLSPFACSRSFTCAICQCGAAASPTPLRRCSPSPTPTILFPPPPLPLPLQSLVHLRHLSVWGSSITNASAPLLPFPPLPPSSFHPHLSPFPCSRSFTCAICQCGAAASPTPLRRCSLFPHSHHPLSTPASPPSPAVARSLAPSVSVGQQHHQRLCAAAPFPPLPPSSFHPRLSPFPCSRSFTCAICQCGAAASPTPLRRCSLFPHSHHPLSTPASPPSPAVARSLAPSVSVGQQHHQRLCAAAPFPPLPPSSFHPRLSPFPCSRSFTCAICQCGAAASPAPLPRCSSPSPACSPPTSPGLPSPTSPPTPPSPPSTSPTAPCFPLASLSPPPHPLPPPPLLPPLTPPPLPPSPSLIWFSLVPQSLLPPPSSLLTSSPSSLTSPRPLYCCCP